MGGSLVLCTGYYSPLAPLLQFRLDLLQMKNASCGWQSMTRAWAGTL